MRIYGVDFTSAPRRAKPITAACAVLQKKVLRLDRVEKLESFPAFERFLARPGPWAGGFDFPFSLPRELARDLGWPARWPGLVAHCARMTRAELRDALDAYRASRPPGRKYAHRATDIPAGSSSPMKLVNPPVALMFHEGARRLAAAGVRIPLLHDPACERIALQAGEPLGIRLTLNPTLSRILLSDGSGDCLDAAICAVQAAWGWTRRKSSYGFPPDAPPGEGWILTA
jgi:hypothetical protein